MREQDLSTCQDGRTFMTNIHKSFERNAAPIQAMIEKRLEQYLSTPPFHGPEILCEALRYAVLSKGKRIRPLLTIAVVDALSGNRERALPAACAIELVHSASLIIDDLPCMDNADLRRFRKTHHLVFGEDLTILSAIGLVNSAYELLNTYAMRDDVEPALAGQLIAGLGKAIGAAGLIGGQISDLRPEPSWDVAGITIVYDRKTVSLFTFAVEAGALIAGATACEYKRLMAYAKNLGLAFQLYDDVIDRNGDSANIGKDVHQDSGKPTFVKVTCQSASEQALKELIVFATQQIAPFGERGRLLADLPWCLYRDSEKPLSAEDERLVASVG